MSTPTADRVAIPAGRLWLLRVGSPVLGLGLAFVVKPLVHWLVSMFSSAPGPLRVAAAIPLPVLVPVLLVVGIGVGYWLSVAAQRDSPTVTVDSDGVLATHKDGERYVARSQLGSAFTDPKDLVLLDRRGRELFRAPATDLRERDLARAFCRHEYPWRGSRDPHEDEYARWVDGHPSLDQETNALLRARRRALDARDRAETERVQAHLQERGIVVRDRNTAQQYRRLADQDTTPG